ncbi:uncharacterized protein LOC115889195 [Sitophilus oryzae]|uniref:Uncharacterized protein LOC115889195 n=1 Tax=Sitophilus oryzae TaxID=7048 RepID=A0A6J2YNY4_SITOR|nr:uncharacterized protein LOC115889195 [Sitophilus oryzae]
MQPSINQICKQARSVGFTFSEEKTSCMHFCRLRRPHYDPLLYLEETPIRCPRTIKFLGIIFDSTHTWKQHILSLKQKCMKSLDILKVLSHTKWGAEPKMLLTLYQSLILSRIDYGCVVYGSACKSSLNILNSIHNAALRYCLGAFPTSPVEGLYCEANIPSLEDRRKIRLSNYMTKILALDEHPYNKICMREAENHPPFSRSAFGRYREYLRIREVDPPQLLRLESSEIPPWKCPPPVVNFELAQFKKGEISNTHWQQSFLDIKNRENVDFVINTDGSKTNDGVGCAFATEDKTFSWTLREVTLLWVPSHVGIAGNEKVDNAAQEASSKDVVDVTMVKPSDYQAYLKSIILKEWQQRWQNLNKNLYRIKPLAYGKYLRVELDRTSLTKTHRLRIGHTALTHKHLLTGEDAPLCADCQVRLTVEHIVCDCPRYEPQRHLFNLVRPYGENLKDKQSIANCLNFLKAVNLFNEI